MTTFSFQIHPNYRPRQTPKIDRPNSRMYGIVAGMDVEATGHGVCCDVKSLEIIAKLANTHPEGIIGRFGHPGMSENATGRKIQLAYHWRVLKGEKADDPHTYLVHDTQFMAAARTSPAFAQDPVEYIMNMAEQHPRHLGESLVLTGATVWTTKDGQELPTWEEVEDEAGNTYKRTRQRPANALTTVPVLRPTAVHFCDIVSEGAITHTGLFPLASPAFPPDRGGLRGDGGAFTSIFTEETAPNYVLDHLFATVDDLRHRFNIPLAALKPKVKRLLSLYLDSRRAREATANEPKTLDNGLATVHRAVRPASVSHQPSSIVQPIYFSRKEADPMSTRRQRLARQRSDRRRLNDLGNPLSASRELTSQPAAEIQADLTEAEELAFETEESLGHASAILDQAEQMANTMVQSTAALTEAPTLATASQVAHLQSQVDQHTDQLHDLTNHLKKLSELLVKNMELTNALQRNITRAQGEPVITQRVPVLGAAGGFEPGAAWVQLQPPTPGAWAASQQPVSTEQRRVGEITSSREQLPTGLDPDSPEARAIRTQQRRAQQTRQS